MLLDQAERSIARAQGSIARMDAARARKIGNLLITDTAAFEAPEVALVDLAKLDAMELLKSYAAKFSRYATTPFDPDGEKLRFYPGGVTIWSGYPGAGKTTLLRQLACHLLHNKQGVFFASLEEDPGDLLIRLGACAFGINIPDNLNGFDLKPYAKKLQWFFDYYADSLRVWGRIGTAKHREIIGIIQQLAKEGVTHAVIDSLMCLDIKNDDFEAQRQFANLLAATARTTQVHIHLVAHPRKAISSDQKPDINDVGGARELGGITDNTIFVRRGEAICGLMGLTPMQVVVRKQRYHTGAFAEFTGWIHQDMRQFKIDQFDRTPTRYLPDEAYA